ncbi:N-6 DNA methylase [Brachyspira hyodysenteriae]|uniref:Eco57I restriction-modification methylase domain-containing protein n=1 Tax=Brachyspira hyodysenteriae TaxID=159 RepID=UPI0022CD95FB|nr:N-6 DNA methylase [Brachyspira hyodysenteriae]MCZ9870552.1 N-6 DNA methylase [Brachyspira hyodysenteriae]MCZ9878718.1 N-6 DNA methylase [Brachyspira hyodysenteriae]MCZ9897677.1 N-6 DNA methylase [Brachyspira hyodysenteriae]MCZ9900013.1 N-6 DNA methylase [Brachyspira hyodysenteriae]MCZ9928614.1 N-6 DNA methylase [Brachyspira hyodysenteriae]
MYSKEEVYKKVEELVIKFRNNKDQYTNKNYNETETRRDFLDPFFEAFGWDVSNRAGKSQTYRDVIHEDKVKVGKETKAPDYAFRIGGNRVFFVEAKKPGVNLKDDNLPAFQLRRYGWSAKLGISFLTDFEELTVYDCTRKPNINDKASTARIEYIHFEDYLNRFDFLYEILNKERIEQGSLEKYISSTSNKKGTESVDIDFLNSLDNLRTKLASNIAKLNKNLSVRDLNYAVQQIIDRIIFLRAAEDRGIEEYGDLKKTCENKGESFYGNLLKIFEKADGRYNSGLFDFSKDSISSSIEIDNKVIKEIINELYYPLSPYEFSVISVEIIGNAYEQFLGKTITIGKNHSAKIELKPEVRKAGGVYYTPEYIVDYIVANTVGEAIKGKKPEEIANIKILDPACGSGSFLLGAYKYLLNYHIEYYNKIKDRAKFKGSKEDVIKENGDLTIWIKKQILRNNIFGVDIDSNAVEVTKLSLLMRCLEGESPASIQNNQDLFNERALPSLEDNIKCGNSLIGNDFYESQSVLDFDEETQYKINCFDWEDEFKTIFKGGGFDVVIGNPPYIYTRNEMFSDEQKDYYYKHFEISDYQLNTYLMFIEKGYKLSNSNGLIGYIIPNNCLTINSFDKFRHFIIDETNYLHIINSYDKIFKDASVDTCILIFSKNKLYDFKHKIGELKEGNFNFKTGDFSELLTQNYIINTSIINKVDSPLFSIINKINEKSSPLSNYSKVVDGIKVYQVGKGIPQQTKKQKEDRAFYAKEKLDDTYIKCLSGVDVKRYSLNWCGDWLSYGKWLAEPRWSAKFNIPRILIRQIPTKPPYCINAIYTDEYYLNDQSSKIIQDIQLYNPLFILGILNSRLISSWFVFTLGKLQRSTFPVILVKEVASLPVPNINLDNKEDKEMHDKMVNLVDSIIALNKKLLVEKNPNAVTMITRQINAVDKQIDALVYKLYNLNDEEVRIIEGE